MSKIVLFEDKYKPEINKCSPTNQKTDLLEESINKQLTDLLEESINKHFKIIQLSQNPVSKMGDIFPVTTCNISVDKSVKSLTVRIPRLIMELNFFK